MPVHTVAVGDSLTPLGAQLLQTNTSDALAAASLSGKTVKVTITDKNNTEILAETETGVTVVDTDNAYVKYDLPTGVSALPAGHYFVWFRVYSGDERDTYPAPERVKRMQLDVTAI